MNSERWVKWVLVIVLSAIGIAACLNFILDPLFQYRYNPDFVPHLKNPQSHLNPGLFRHYPYDTIVLGTSMVENFRPSIIKSTLGLQAINARISGGSAFQQSTVLRQALKYAKLRKVIWGVDLFSFSGEANRNADQIPQYLYQDFIWDDYRYLLNIDTLKSALKTLAAHWFDQDSRYLDLDSITARYQKYEFSREQTLKAWQTGDFNKDYRPDQYSYARLKNNFDQNFKALLEKTSAIDYLVLFPPYSILAWKDIEKKGWLHQALAFKRYLVTELLRYDNIMIYDFQSDELITHDLNNYKDPTHYSISINRKILESMRKDTYRVKDIETLTRNNTRLRQQISALNLADFTRSLAN